MNVLHVIPAIAPRYGGPSVAVIRMCTALMDQGAHVLLATSDADGRGRLDVELGRMTTHQGVPAVFFARAASEAYKWTPALGRWLRANVSAFDIVHVHAVFSYACLAAARACRAANRPYIVRPLGSLDPWSLRRHRVRKHALLGVGMRRMLHGAAALHYTSREEQRLAEGGLTGLARGVVIPLGVDEDLFEDAGDGVGSADRERCVLALSRLDPKKGLEVLIEAFHQLADRGGAAWRLVIAGDGESSYVAHLHRLADGGPARNRIAFTGWVEGQARRAVFRNAALYALPSHQENFGISVVEAMASGMPVLVSPGVNLASDIEAARAGWAASRDVPIWTEALDQAMSNPAELRRRGDNARRFAAQFRWAHVAARLLELYQALASRHTTSIEEPRTVPSAPHSAPVS